MSRIPILSRLQSTKSVKPRETNSPAKQAPLYQLLQVSSVSFPVFNLPLSHYTHHRLHHGFTMSSFAGLSTPRPLPLPPRMGLRLPVGPIDRKHTGREPKIYHRPNMRSPTKVFRQPVIPFKVDPTIRVMLYGKSGPRALAGPAMPGTSVGSGRTEGGEATVRGETCGYATSNFDVEPSQGTSG
jgi:hypothetical protein